MRLSKNFLLSEFTLSQTAERNGWDNDPPPEVIENLREVAETLERVRARLGNVAIVISSGYRSRALNAALPGASNTSAHITGWAADFTVPGYGSPLTVARAISSMPDVRFDQLIHEFGRWVHLGVGPGQRMQRLTIDRQGTRNGLLETRR